MKLKETLTLVMVGLLVVSGFGIAVGTLEGTDIRDIGESNEDSNDSLTEGNTVEGNPIEIEDWHDLDAVRDDLDGDYVLMNDLDEDTDGYEELVNTEEGWEPIGEEDLEFVGTLDGNEHEINDLYIDRPNTDEVALFGYVDTGGEVRNVSVVDSDVSGRGWVGGLVGSNNGTVLNSYSIGDVSGKAMVGGLVGWNDGTVKKSYATGVVSGMRWVGGLVGSNEGGTVDNSYATGVVSGEYLVGGLVGESWYGTVENSYATGEVSGEYRRVGGLVGSNNGMVSNSYATGNVSGDNDKVGGFIGSNRGSVENSYATGDVNGEDRIGGLVGRSRGIVKNSHATGTVSGESTVGGLVGKNHFEGKVENSHATGNVSGESTVGGLVGWNEDMVENSYYNIDEVLINGENHVTLGGLFDAQYQDWIEDKSLDISDYSDTLVPSNHHYEIRSVEGIRDLLGFAEHEEYNFRLTENIDLSAEPGLYIPYLVADFDGNGHTISNLHIDMPFANNLGMFGHIDHSKVFALNIVDSAVNGYERIGGLSGENDGIVKNSYATGNVSGEGRIGGLVGNNYDGTVSDSYATGNVRGDNANVGGLVGRNDGMMEDSYATGNVSGEDMIGGLVGRNDGTVENSYANGNVSGNQDVGGLIGFKDDGTVSDSFWDIDTSGQDESDGGTGLTTDEMTGEDAPNNMDGFDFEEVWETVEEDHEDAEEDGYPILQELSREEQLKYVYPADPVEEEGFDMMIGGIILIIVITLAIIGYMMMKGGEETELGKEE